MSQTETQTQKSEIEALSSIGYYITKLEVNGETHKVPIIMDSVSMLAVGVCNGLQKKPSELKILNSTFTRVYELLEDPNNDIMIIGTQKVDKQLIKNAVEIIVRLDYFKPISFKKGLREMMFYQAKDKPAILVTNGFYFVLVAGRTEDY